MNILNALIISILVFACGKTTEAPIPDIKAPNPTPTPNFITENVSLQNLNSVPPDGIIEEVGFFVGGMGGAGCFDDRFKTPEFSPELPESIELVPLDILRSIQVSLCGVQPGETIKLSIQNNVKVALTEESATAQSISGQKRGYVDFSSYTFPTETPPGDYDIRVKGKNWVLESTLTIERPHKAHLWLQDSSLIFYGFQPNEIVKLLIYTDTDHIGYWKFNGWNQVKTNQVGELALKVGINNISDLGFLAFRNNKETIPSEIPGGGSDFALNTFYSDGVNSP